MRGNGSNTRNRLPRRDVAPVHGANALQLDYAVETEPSFDTEPRFDTDPSFDTGPPFDDRSGDVLAPPRPRAPRPRPSQRPSARPVSRPATVAPPAPMALPRAPFLLMVVVLVIVGVLGVLVLNTKINENSFVLDGLRASQRSLDLQEQQLARDLEEAQSPGSLRAAAKRLGLVPAGTLAFITLPDGKIVGVPTPATDPDAKTADR